MFKQFLIEERPLTISDLAVVDKFADSLFGAFGIDVKFTKHFLDRANDDRNGKQITVKELMDLLNKEFMKYGKEISKLPSDTEAIMRDMRSNINCPFYFEWIPNKKMFELRFKTIIRKKDWYGADKQFKV